MSIIETPPKESPVDPDHVVKFDAPVIERAVQQRAGARRQVYFVHNRVESIFSIGNLLQRGSCPSAIVVGHGQMGEDELERAMLGFVERRFDVLLATTIVENGLDIPNANTIIINRADRYGCRSSISCAAASADRIAGVRLPADPAAGSLSPVAQKRLAAIKEFSDLGSGFRVAALDLEIRGAGNLLGGEQSGHIETVGFEMYMKLLEETIRELKGEDSRTTSARRSTCGSTCKIDDSYIPDMNQRLMVYRKVRARREPSRTGVGGRRIRDRYGAPPASVLNLAEYGRIRHPGRPTGCRSHRPDGRLVVIRFRPQAKAGPGAAVQGRRRMARRVVVPPVSLRLDLEAPRESQASGQGAARRRGKPASPGSATENGSAGGPTGQQLVDGAATAGEVTAGFTKEEILRKPESDPRAAGLFAGECSSARSLVAAHRRRSGRDGLKYALPRKCKC
jgi:transcription-repair coupling factor (superfamily II helicase)